MPTDTRRWPRELHSHLHPMPVDVLHNLIQTFIFMPAADLEAERETIAKCVPIGDYAQAPTREEGFALGCYVARLAPFGEPPSADVLQRSLAPLSPMKAGALTVRLEQIRRAVWQAQHLHGQDYDPTDVFAVSPIWHHRWETLIGGALYPAFVGFLEAGRF